MACSFSSNATSSFHRVSCLWYSACVLVSTSVWILPLFAAKHKQLMNQGGNDIFPKYGKSMEGIAL